MTIPQIRRGDWLGTITKKRMFPWRYQHLQVPLEVTIDDERCDIEGNFIGDPDNAHNMGYTMEGNVED